MKQNVGYLKAVEVNCMTHESSEKFCMALFLLLVVVVEVFFDLGVMFLFLVWIFGGFFSLLVKPWPVFFEFYSTCLSTGRI